MPAGSSLPQNGISHAFLCSPSKRTLRAPQLASGPPPCPRVSKAKLKGSPSVAETACPSHPIPPESRRHDVSHAGGPLRIRHQAGPSTAHVSLSTDNILCQAGTRHNLPHHRLLPPSSPLHRLAVRNAGVLQGHGVLALRPVPVAVVFPSPLCTCVSAWHHGALCPYWPSGQSGKSTPRGQRRSVLRPANRNSPAQPFSAVWEPPHPSLPPREPWPLGTTLCAGRWFRPCRGAWGSLACVSCRQPSCTLYLPVR